MFAEHPFNAPFYPSGKSGKSHGEQAFRNADQPARATIRHMLSLLVVAVVAQSDEERAQKAIVNVEVRGAILSGVICFQTERKAAAQAVIADEKKKARLTGVSNLADLNWAGDEIVDADKEIAWAMQKLRAKKMATQRCTDELVAEVVTCLGPKYCGEGGPLVYGALDLLRQE